MSIYVLILFFLFALLGVPLAISLGLSALTVLVFLSDFPPIVAANVIFGSMNSFVMVAVPLFVLAGAVMESAGIAERIFYFANAMVGHWRGGLGHVNVVASMIFGGMSGSSVADAASLGPIEISAMTKHHYPKDYAAAISVASSTLAVIIPPSILLIVAGTVGDQSVGKLLVAGIVPGVFIGICLMATNYLISTRKHYGVKSFFTWRGLWTSAVHAFPALLTPLIIMGGILEGTFTPTEAAGIAVVYAILVSVCFYRDFDLRKLPRVFFNSAKTSGIILFIAMTARIATWIFTIDGLPEQLAGFILSISQNPQVVMLTVIGFLIILGMFMDIMAALIILVPILVPTAIQVSIDPVHFIVTMVGALAIGLVTPPVGVCLFAICQVSSLTMEQVVKKIIPFILVLIFAILVIGFWPSMSLWLPNMVMK